MFTIKSKNMLCMNPDEIELRADAIIVKGEWGIRKVAYEDEYSAMCAYTDICEALENRAPIADISGGEVYRKSGK